MLELPCIAKLCSLACTLLATSSKAFDFEIASQLFETGDRTSELALAFHDGKQRDAVSKTLDNLRKRVQRDSEEWLETEFRGEPAALADAQAAIATLDFVLPRCLPDKAAIISAKYDPRAIADLVVNAAAATDEQFQRNTVGARILTCLVRRLYEVLQDDEAFCTATEIPFRKHVLSNFEDIKQGQRRHDGEFAKLIAMLASLSAEKSVPIPALQEILKRFGEFTVTSDPEVIEQRLRIKADEYAALRNQWEQATTAWPGLAEARAGALRLADTGDFAGARTILERARERRRQIAREEEVILIGEEAAVARLEFCYAEAAKLYAEAADLMTHDLALRWRCLVLAALALGEDSAGVEREPLLDELVRYGAELAAPWSIVVGPNAEVPTKVIIREVSDLVQSIRQPTNHVFPAWEELHQLASQMRRLGDQLQSTPCLLAACALRERIANSTADLTISDPIDIVGEFEGLGDALVRLSEEKGLEPAVGLALNRYSLAQGYNRDGPAIIESISEKIRKLSEK